MVEIKDENIQNALIKGTDDAVLLKDTIWCNIEDKLDFNNKEVITLKKKKNTFLKYSTAAAVLAIVIIISSKWDVNAAVSKIKDFFVPNKTVEQKIEGANENINLELKESPMKYIIYIDKDTYNLENSSGKDIITPKNKAEGVPEVSMTIEQVLNKNPKTAIAEIEKNLNSKFKTVQNLNKVTSPVNGLAIYAQNGNKWNDTVVKYYFVDNTKGGTFIIKEQYFLEATEGHGTRFDNMLKEFKIVNQ